MAGMKHGAWCHIEIPTASAEAAKKFYGAAFGWTFIDVPQTKYTLYQAGKDEIGGGFFTPSAGTPRQMMNYVNVDDLEASAKRVQDLGGRILGDRVEVPTYGSFRPVADPEGNAFALWQSRPEPAAPKPKKKAPASRRRSSDRRK